ncbi:MAG: hypothetical protein ACREBR_00485 [bacterium]
MDSIHHKNQSVTAEQVCHVIPKKDMLETIIGQITADFPSSMRKTRSKMTTKFWPKHSMTYHPSKTQHV